MDFGAIPKEARVDYEISDLVSLKAEIETAISKIGIKDKKAKLAELSLQMSKADFWNDSKKAEQTSRLSSQLQTEVELWEDMQSEISDIIELAKLDDESLKADIQATFEKVKAKYSNSKIALMFSGKYDDHDVILSIHSGAGGTDAQDWAAMIERMYLRWAEAKEFKVQIIDRSPGEEAGIKSVTMSIEGLRAFGLLRSEHGVHRLVRLSPFNADSLRQTSFAKVEVVPKIDADSEVEVDEKDLKIDVYRSGGHGGQSVNTTDSAVRITHLPTGIVIAIQNERSQVQNKETAMTILRSKLAKLKDEQHKEKISELKGPNEQAAWGNQIRNYVLHPYSMVKDTRTKFESSDPASVLDGNLDDFMFSYLENQASN